jgi:hypothetical protein
VDIGRSEQFESELDAMIERHARQNDPDEERELWRACRGQPGDCPIQEHGARAGAWANRARHVLRETVRARRVGPAESNA